MFTGRMNFDELERFYYITNDPRHAALLIGEEEASLMEQIEQLEHQVRTLGDEENERVDELEREISDLKDDQEETIKERDRLRIENNAHVAEILRLRQPLDLSKFA